MQRASPLVEFFRNILFSGNGDLLRACAYAAFAASGSISVWEILECVRAIAEENPARMDLAPEFELENKFFVSFTLVVALSGTEPENFLTPAGMPSESEDMRQLVGAIIPAIAHSAFRREPEPCPLRSFLDSIAAYITTGDADAVLEVINNPTFDVNCFSWHLTPLELAALMDVEEAIDALLDRGADPNLWIFESPLALARSPTAACALLRAGVSPEFSIRPNGYGAFELALMAGEIDLARVYADLGRPIAVWIPIIMERPDYLRFVVRDCGIEPDRPTLASVLRALYPDSARAFLAMLPDPAAAIFALEEDDIATFAPGTRELVEPLWRAPRRRAVALLQRKLTHAFYCPEGPGFAAAIARLRAGRSAYE